MTVVNRRWISGAIVEGNSALDLEHLAIFFRLKTTRRRVDRTQLDLRVHDLAIRCTPEIWIQSLRAPIASGDHLRISCFRVRRIFLGARTVIVL